MQSTIRNITYYRQKKKKKYPHQSGFEREDPSLAKKTYNLLQSKTSMETKVTQRHRI